MVVRSRTAFALLCLALGTAGVFLRHHLAPRPALAAAELPNVGMAHMAGHMYMTSPRPQQPGDQQKADAVVAAAKQAMAPYEDYRKALADGYTIFLPEVPQPQYHFTKREYGFAAAFHFDPLKPTSLLYKKTADGGYKLIGAMYTDRVNATEDELNERIPLSMVRWHEHTKFCAAPANKVKEYFGEHPKFGMFGSITTAEACKAEGGTFFPVIFNWMIHVFPYESDLKDVFSMNDDIPHFGKDRPF